MDSEEILVMRADRAVKERLRRFQGRVQMIQGRRITMKEALDIALASAEAQMPAGVEPTPDNRWFTEQPEPESTGRKRKVPTPT